VKNKRPNVNPTKEYRNILDKAFAFLQFMPLPIRKVCNKAAGNIQINAKITLIVIVPSNSMTHIAILSC